MVGDNDNVPREPRKRAVKGDTREGPPDQLSPRNFGGGSRHLEGLGDRGAKSPVDKGSERLKVLGDRGSESLGGRGSKSSLIHGFESLGGHSKTLVKVTDDFGTHIEVRYGEFIILDRILDDVLADLEAKIANDR
jgi:hypothetical protein